METSIIEITKIYNNCDSCILPLIYAHYSLHDYARERNDLKIQKEQLEIINDLIKDVKVQDSRILLNFEISIDYAAYYRKIGENAKAEFLLKSLILENENPINLPYDQFEYYNYTLQQLAFLEADRSNLNKAIQYLKYSITIEEERARIDKREPVTNSLYCRLGKIYDDLGDINLAKQYFEICNKAYVDFLEEDNFQGDYIYTYHYINFFQQEASVNLKSNNYERVEFLLEVINKIKKNDNPRNNFTLLLEAEYYFKIGEVQKANEYFEKANNEIFSKEKNFDQQLSYYITKQKINPDDYFNEDIEILDSILLNDKIFSIPIIQLLSQKIDNFFRTNDYNQILKYDKIIASILEERFKKSIYFDDQILYVNYLYPVFEKILETYYELQNQKEIDYQNIFTLFENLKAIDLYKSSLLKIYRNEYDRNLDSLNYDQLKEIKLTLEKRDDTLSLSESNKLIETNNKLEIIYEEVLKNRYISEGDHSLKSFQKVTSKSNFISVFSGVTNYYFLTIQKNDIHLHQIYRDTLDESINAHLENLRSPQNGNFKTSGKKLYTLLKDVIPNKNDLIISSDGPLKFIPFETLMDEKGAYLIQDQSIQYVPSAQLAMLLKQKENDGKNNFALFQPDQSMVALNYVDSEAQSLAGLFPVSLFKSHSAIKDSFFKTSADFNILHLATHAKADEEDPFGSVIYFTEDGQNNPHLYFDEIKSLNLDADLVTLSACETNIGKNYIGEGMQSLARNFIAAGARSVVASMWSISDQTTSEIMISFYIYLKKGYSKSEALQKAKIEYLNAYSGEALHPYYWAGLVLTGDDSPVFQKSVNYPLWVGVGLGVVILGGIGYKKYKYAA